jgi:hypothetical protein
MMLWSWGIVLASWNTSGLLVRIVLIRESFLKCSKSTFPNSTIPRYSMLGHASAIEGRGPILL